jgi:hypothetical protein
MASSGKLEKDLRRRFFSPVSKVQESQLARSRERNPESQSPLETLLLL